MTNYPKISVVTITYGHEKYIIEALKGVFMQEYGGQIEFVIANDNSPDNTENVIKEFVKNNPPPANISIKLTSHLSNKGMKSNFIWALGQATGDYVAICEGDDYWTDPLKLQKQSAFLENNPGYVLSFHNAQPLKTVINNFEYNIVTKDRDYNSDDLFISWVAPTASFFFSSKCLPNIFKKLDSPDVLNPDLVVLLSCMEIGKCRGIEKKMSVYRIHDEGISQVRFAQNKLKHLKNYLKHYEYIGNNFSEVSTEKINIKLVDINSTIASEYLKRKNYRFLYHGAVCFYYRPDLFRKGFNKVVTKITKKLK